MVKPRAKFRERPKKSGAKKKRRIETQKKRLSAVGKTDDELRHLTVGEIRDELKKAAKKSSPNKVSQKTVAKAVKVTKTPKAKKAVKPAKTTKPAKTVKKKVEKKD